MKKGIQKQQLIDSLKGTLQLTRAGADIVSMELENDRLNEDVVLIKFVDGRRQYINIACDSGASIIMDVCMALM